VTWRFTCIQLKRTKTEYSIIFMILFVSLLAWVWRTYLFNFTYRERPPLFWDQAQNLILHYILGDMSGRIERDEDWQCGNVLRIYSSLHSLLVKPREKLWFPLREETEEHTHTHTHTHPSVQVYVLRARCGPLPFTTVLTGSVWSESSHNGVEVTQNVFKNIV